HSRGGASQYRPSQ
nr:Chain P, Myelin basic protein (MBP)-peptide [synthetic construct]